jgi:MoaA/NifB/PqqE/SkfB family radical SAM enzyme
MIEAALALGPVSVLTNGLLIRRETAERLRALAEKSPHALEIRVSLDGMDAAANDAVRGAGTFDRILAACAHLAQAGLPPIVTVTEACGGADTAEGRDRLLALLRAAGVSEPRLKVLPLLRIGAEPSRTRAYCDKENLRGVALDDCALSALQCSSSRMVTSRGAYVCPILIDFPDARLGARLADALGPFTLRHSACFTCHRRKLSCRN